MVGWNTSLIEPILFYPENDGAGAQSGLTKSDQEVASEFAYAGISDGTLSNFAEDTIVNFDSNDLEKIRATAISALASQNQAKNTDFEKMRKNAIPLRWREIKAIMATKNSGNSELKRMLLLRDYLIRFACDAGSSPYITGALIDNNIVFDIESGVVALIKKELDKGAQAEVKKPDVEAHLLLATLNSPNKCPGAKELKKRHRVQLRSYEDFVNEQLGKSAANSKAAKFEDDHQELKIYRCTLVRCQNDLVAVSWASMCHLAKGENAAHQ